MCLPDLLSSLGNLLSTVLMIKCLAFRYFFLKNAFYQFMHLSFVTTAPHPRGRAGDSRGNERAFDKSFAMAVRGKYPGFALYGQKVP